MYHGRVVETHADVDLSDADYQRLLRMRDGLRSFLRWSGQQAEMAGVTPAQHQLLLVVRGHDPSNAPTIGDVAEHLLLRHHSAVELVDRAVRAELVRRRILDRDDHRTVRLALTAHGTRTASSLSASHIEELRRMNGRLGMLWQGLEVVR